MNILTTKKVADAYRARNKDEERISPHAPKPYKASIWSQIMKQEIKGQWHHNCIAIKWKCCHIYISNIKAPRSTLVGVFLYEVGGTVSKSSKHKHQCRRDPDKPISSTIQKLNTNELIRSSGQSCHSCWLPCSQLECKQAQMIRCMISKFLQWIYF